MLTQILFSSPCTHVLVAPLDWGLGHAARCVPLIRALRDRQVRVTVAAEGEMLAWLRHEFPDINYLILRGYRIRYRKGGRFSFLLNGILRLPKLLLQWRREHRWLRQQQPQQSFDLILSDNRPGIRLPGVRSVYLTHQWNVRTGFRLLDPLAGYLHRRLFRRFDECWIPDYPKPHQLAGALSLVEGSPRPPVTYLGPLSRMRPLTLPHRYDLAILLSGPEPQRTLLEQKILIQLHEFSGSVILVRGTGGPGLEAKACPKQLQVEGLVSSQRINEILCSSSLVLCRSGYTSLMELVSLGVPALLVPTPGQGEQEYLARMLAEKKWFHSVTQEELNLPADLERARNCHPPIIK